jgi:hypothetical protein
MFLFGGRILFLFPNRKKYTSLFSLSLQDINKGKQQLKRNSFKKQLP